MTLQNFKFIKLTNIDFLFITLLCIPIIQFLMSMFVGNINNEAAIITLINDTLIYYPYFVGRLLINKHHIIIRYSSYIIFFASIGISLQYFGFLDSLYGDLSEHYIRKEKTSLGASFATYLTLDQITKFRPDFIFGNWHLAGHVISLAFVYTLTEYYKKNDKTLLMIAIFFFFIVFMTESRASLFMSLIISSLIIISNLDKKIFYFLKKKIHLAIFLIILTLYLLSLLINNSIYQSENLYEIITTRLGYLSNSFFYIIDNPIYFLVGYGYGNAGISIVQTKEVLPINVVDNIVIIELVNYGLIVLIIKNLIYFYILKFLICNKLNTFLTYFMLMIIFSQLIGSYMLERSVTFIIYLLIGSFVSQLNLSKKNNTFY